MPEEKIKKAEKIRSIMRFTSADEYLGTPPMLGGVQSGGGEVDELDRLKANDLKEKTHRLRSLEVDAYIANKEAEINKAKTAVAPPAQPALVAQAPMVWTPQMMELFANMDDARRDKLTQTMMMLNSSQGGKMDPGMMLYMTSMMGNVAKQNPEMTQSQLFELAFKFNEATQAGFKMAKEMQPALPTNTRDPVEVALKITEYLKTNSSASMEERITNLIKEVRPQESFLEQLIMKPENTGLAQRIFGGAQSSDNVEIERLKYGHDIEMAKINDIRDERVATHNTELASETARFNILNGLVTSLAPALARVVQGMGEAAAAKMATPPQQQQTQQVRQAQPVQPQTTQEGVEIVPPEQVIHAPTQPVEGQLVQEPKQPQTQQPGSPQVQTSHPETVREGDHLVHKGQMPHVDIVECVNCGGMRYVNEGQQIDMCPWCGYLKATDEVMRSLVNLVHASELGQTTSKAQG